jgi:serine/threonine protein kinase
MSFYCECGRENNISAGKCNVCGRPLLNPTLNCNLKPGAILNKRYIVKKVIKDIGTDALYEAIDEGVGNSLCLIKEIFISDSSAEKESTADFFMREARTLQGCKHRNLPAVRDYFTEQDRYYLVMDYIDGSDLEALIVKYIPENVPEVKVIEWTSQLIDLMEYFYEKCPSIYKDLNPGNIMVDQHHEELKLIDAGISKTGKSEKSNISNDIYSLGVIMYCLLTGKFSMDLKPVPAKEINRHVSNELNRIVMKSLSKKEGRYRKFGDLKEDLAGVPGKKEHEAIIPVSNLIPKKRHIPYYSYRRKNGKNFFNKVKTVFAVIVFFIIAALVAGKYVTNNQNIASATPTPVIENTPSVSKADEDIKLLDTYMNDKKYSDAKKLLDKLEIPDKIDKYIEIGNKLLDQHEYNPASDCFREVLKLEKDNLSSLKGLSLIYFETKDYNKAISVNKKIISICPSDIPSHIAIGTSYYKFHEYTMATKWLKKALSLKPGNTDREIIVSMISSAYLSMGQKNLSEKKYDEGASYFKKVLHLGGNNIQAKEGLAKCFINNGRLCFEKNNYMEARKWFNEVISLNINGQEVKDSKNYLSLIEKNLGYASNNYYKSDYYSQNYNYSNYDSNYENQDTYNENNSPSVNSELHYDNIPAGGNKGKSNNSEGNSELHYE